MALLLQAFYNAIMLGFSWFSLANFYIFFVSFHDRDVSSLETVLILFVGRSS